jgi:anti-sigma regulatory factor (Ser/Thr protein kinase)
MNAPSYLESDEGARAQRLIHVVAPADVGEARRQGAELASLLAFDPTTTGQLALAITEAATNIVKHACDGMVLLRPLGRPTGACTVEALVLDRGEGIPNLALSMRDGYSTAGTPGGGLGALSRNTLALEIYSQAGKGTALRFEVGPRLAVSAPAALTVGAVCVPKPGETACGDAWTMVSDRGRYALAVIDGLGHGVDAAAAARIAVGVSQRHGAASSSVETMQRLHAALLSSRGAAGAVAVLEPQHERGAYCGIGNISCTVCAHTQARKLVSHYGILGHRTRSMHEYGFTFPPDANVIAHSDGLNTHWRLDAYPGLDRYHPALIAGVLYRDHARGNDDATCVVVRHNARTTP